jgi:hypothetical protein
MARKKFKFLAPIERARVSCTIACSIIIIFQEKKKNIIIYRPCVSTDLRILASRPAERNHDEREERGSNTFREAVTHTRYIHPPPFIGGGGGGEAASDRSSTM